MNPEADPSAIFTAAQREELAGIIRQRSFRTGTFTLSSGKQSSLYFNLKPTMLDARGAELSARGFIALMAQVGGDYVSGLEMGAVPAIGAMAALGGLVGFPVRATFVRKRAKEHGTRENLEGLGPGESVADRKVFVIDDVATSGASILKAVEEVRAAGGLVTDAAALVNRHEGGDVLMREHGVKLHHVFSAREFGVEAY